MSKHPAESKLVIVRFTSGETERYPDCSLDTLRDDKGSLIAFVLRGPEERWVLSIPARGVLTIKEER